ncbi:hypothetical protein TNCV_1018041 [Trichonephila clavipes]|uniref:Uncharacterized protein n=1 Tax=Trichonephila clavipes TaxID=2585209 RepID=A0A8X6VY77_TRICX|nr:hypothetical protein TNCV_1018041 [Trichonephila clavipes]
MVGKKLLVHKALGEAKNSVFHVETALSQAKCFQWDNGTDISCSQLDVASLHNWPTLSHYRDFHYDPST